MDVNEYISSGILEAYALGLVSDQERKEVECMSHIYPEIREELGRVAAAMENLAQKQQVQPPAALKNKIFEQLANEKPSAAAVTAREATVVSMQAQTAQPKGGAAFKWMAAACLVGLLGVGALYLRERSVSGELGQQLQAFKTSAEEKQGTIERLERESSITQSELAMFRNPDFKTVFLKSTPDKPAGSLAIVCANVKTGETVMAVENLPGLPTDRQYQLWAIVNGTPVDMGVLPKDSAATRTFIKMKNIEGAQAFAITMEKDGGSPVPTLTEMYVMGAAI